MNEGKCLADQVCLVMQRIASTLLNRGRLPAPTIARLVGLPRPTTYAALLILIQHDLVQSNGASYKDTGEDEQYEFDVTECMMRLRWGRILAITHEKMDDVVSVLSLDIDELELITRSFLPLQALEVVRQLMIFGKLKVPEIVATCGGQHDALRESPPLYILAKAKTESL